MTPVQVTASERRVITSTQTGRSYQISIALPLGYAKLANEAWPFNNTSDKWPVVYVLDGDWYFGAVTGLIRPMCWCGSTTDAIVVGIGYEDAPDPIDALWQSFTRRDYDLTPIRVEADERVAEDRHNYPSPTGDGGNFLKFLKEELIPTIETDYHADPAKRVLVGHSYGGLLGLLSMYEAPDLFNSLILGSPTMSYGERVMVKREEAFAKDHKQLPANVYLFAGDLEEDANDTTLTDTLRLAATLEGRRYEGFSLAKQVFADQNHCEVAVAGFQWGLKLALRRLKKK